ncbi:hypothetical protein BGX29_006202 [Mortierella sp. GBA35]|nr:hypothetical protein BGX29_006202 [Mortierella sp. GBA35]
MTMAANATTPDSHHDLSPSPPDILEETVWMQIKSWIPFVLNLMVGFGLRTILSEWRQKDLELEVLREKQGRLLATDKELPTPVASASSVEGFKTEAEMHRLRLRVPTWPRFLMGLWFLFGIFYGVMHISHMLTLHSGWNRAQIAFYFIQSAAGLHALYSKSLFQTQWVFYSVCASTLYQAITVNMAIWAAEIKDDQFLFPGAPIEVLSYFRCLMMVGFTLLLAARLWIAWRLMADLKARDARVAKAIQVQERVRADNQSLDAIVTNSVDHQSTDMT